LFKECITRKAVRGLARCTKMIVGKFLVIFVCFVQAYSIAGAQFQYNQSMTHAIILFSHGSVLCGAGQNLLDLARQMRKRGDAPIVEVGYLNYSEPLFADTFRNCVAQGATRVTVVPYFLVAGKFVKDDLPKCIAAAQAEFPDVEIGVADAIRFHPGLVDALLACAERAQPPAAWRDTKAQVAAFCRANPRCPLYGTDDCPATRSVEVVT